MTTLQLDLQVISERARTGRGVARFCSGEWNVKAPLPGGRVEIHLAGL